MEVKVESEDEVEPYEGTYACGFCFESLRGMEALKCSRCSANPVHRKCAGAKYARLCASCGWETMEVWRGPSAGTAAPGVMIDLTDVEGEGGCAAEVATLTANVAREEADAVVEGAAVATEEVGRGVQGRKADAGGGSRGKGKEIAWEEVGPKAGIDGGATSAGAGGDGGGGEDKGQADNGRRRARRGCSDGESA